MAIIEQVYREPAFTAAGSPIILDVFGDLGHNARRLNAICDGPGAIKFEMSGDSSVVQDPDFGEGVTLEENESIKITGTFINRIRVTLLGEDSAYRIAVYGR